MPLETPRSPSNGRSRSTEPDGAQHTGADEAEAEVYDDQTDEFDDETDEFDDEYDDADDEYDAPRRRSRGLITAVAVVAVLVLGVVAFSIGRLSAIGTTTPTTTSAEAGFSRDMQVHHDQGVLMAMMVRDRTDDAAVRSLAYDLALTQSTQLGMMSGWLSIWGLPQYPPEPSMTWMTRPGLDGTGHDHTGQAEAAHVPGEPMPGLATDEQLRELEGQSGVEAERTFLRLMIDHHVGAVEMAEAVIDRSTHPVVTTFASGVLTGQQAEIDLMEDMLDERAAE